MSRFSRHFEKEYLRSDIDPHKLALVEATSVNRYTACSAIPLHISLVISGQRLVYQSDSYHEA
jgi:hypothetical protein